ncbi:GntR family transcriptional regulator [Amycolatopsis sp. WAC 01375]|uniref:GntR family transcriptional regulator n=1 Tax=unclassified Amycolatopsis TaxID=2618356 RepID=UPI000F7A1C15|nr:MULTISPECIES: GntR family transcriptional regulator [unclassified Amycolatopsis]RSM69348.1 GntR family transcriptional regulator [Amycolatopsis sp. WAC 01375]RSN30986.1 GntR family transcriptional regulator [Amycolatopsis sp. WAC 01416]
MTQRTLARSGAEPLWRQLQRELLARLDAGDFTDQFPGELALVEEYGVSRHTVRQALRQLRADGVIVAERGRQPRVAPPAEIAQPLGALYSLFASVEAAGLPQHSVVRFFDVRADALVAERLDLEASTPLVYLERLRLAGDEPLALDRVWLPADLARPLMAADFSHTSLYTELAARAGVKLDRGREEVHAVIPTAAERRQLACAHDVAAFAINRLSHSRDRAVEWRHTLVRGDRYALTAEFSAAGYRLVAPD